MKSLKITLFFAIVYFLFNFSSSAQNRIFEYSIPMTDLTGAAFAEGTVTWEAEIYEKSKGKPLVWKEGASDETNSKGLLKIKIGKDGEASGPYSSFNEINFGQMSYIIKITIINTDVKPSKIKPIKLNPVMYSLYAGGAVHSIKADTALVALSSSTDTDGDGVSDGNDKERFSPTGAKVDKYGRAEDNDKDGVPDILDTDPNTPEGEMVNFQGKSISGAGSSVVGGGSGSMVKGGDFLPAIFFERDFVLEPNNCALLMVVYNYMKANPTVKLKVIGHTDSFGTDEYNLKLGMRRAQAVIDAIVALGIPEERLVAESKGEAEPLVDVTQFRVLNFNRRVQFELLK